HQVFLSIRRSRTPIARVLVLAAALLGALAAALVTLHFWDLAITIGWDLPCTMLFFACGGAAIYQIARNTAMLYEATHKPGQHQRRSECTQRQFLWQIVVPLLVAAVIGVWVFGLVPPGSATSPLRHAFYDWIHDRSVLASWHESLGWWSTPAQ